MTALLLDEGLPFRTASVLRAEGIDAAHVREADLTGARDSEVLGYARANGRAVVTLDHDFHLLLAEGQSDRPSVVLIRIQRLDYRGAANLILALLPRLSDELNRGVAVTVTTKGIRVRALPLK